MIGKRHRMDGDAISVSTSIEKHFVSRCWGFLLFND